MNRSCAPDPALVPSSTSARAVHAKRDALARLVEPLRARLGTEEAALVDLLLALAATAPTYSPTISALVDERTREPCLAASLGAASWEEIRIIVVDGHTVRIGCRKRTVLRTYRDLGLHGARSRMPTRKWEMLVAMGEGHGSFRWRDFGERRAVSQAMSVLRAKLKAAVGLEDDPFHAWDGGWRAKFFASSEFAGG